MRLIDLARTHARGTRPAHTIRALVSFVFIPSRPWKALETPGRPFLHNANRPRLAAPDGPAAKGDEICPRGASCGVEPEPGGAGRDRTDDLMLAKHALYQLSYGPSGPPGGKRQSVGGGPRRTRTADLTLIRRVL